MLRCMNAALALPRQGSTIGVLTIRDTDNGAAAHSSRPRRAVEGLLQNLWGVIITFGGRKRRQSGSQKHDIPRDAAQGAHAVAQVPRNRARRRN